MPWLVVLTILFGCGSVKEGMNEFQNAIFSGSMFFCMDVFGLNEIYCLSLRVYAGQSDASVGFLH